MFDPDGHPEGVRLPRMRGGERRYRHGRAGRRGGLAANIRALLRQVIAEAGGGGVAAVLSVQGDAIIPVDPSGACLHPAILGMDYRSTDQARAAEERLGGWRIFRHTGMRPHPLNALCKILWLRDERPRVLTGAAGMRTYEDFILSRLGVEPAIDVTMASRTMALELRREDWSSWLLGRFAIDPACSPRW